MGTRNDIGELLKEQGLIDLPACEVGVAEGRYSEIILGWGVPYLYLVDLWEHVPQSTGRLGDWSDTTHKTKMLQAIGRVSKFPKKYEVLRGWSHDMCRHINDGSLGFCYIDATHDESAVLQDLYNYWPKLVHNGMMAGQDWTLEGVQRAVKTFAEQKDLNIHLLDDHPNDISFWLERK